MQNRGPTRYLFTVVVLFCFVLVFFFYVFHLFFNSAAAQLRPTMTCFRTWLHLFINTERNYFLNLLGERSPIVQKATRARNYARDFRRFRFAHSTRKYQNKNQPFRHTNKIPIRSPYRYRLDNGLRSISLWLQICL